MDFSLCLQVVEGAMELSGALSVKAQIPLMRVLLPNAIALCVRVSTHAFKGTQMFRP